MVKTIRRIAIKQYCSKRDHRQNRQDQISTIVVDNMDRQDRHT